MEPGSRDADAALASDVEALAASGAAVLVVGRVPAAARVAFSRPLASSDGSVVLVLAGPDSACLELRRETDATRCTLVRPASSGPTPAAGRGHGTERVVDGGAAALATATVAAVDDTCPTTPRVCLDPVTGLFASDGPDAAFRALHHVAGRVREGDGVAHCHLPLDREDEAVSLLDPLFDAVVELATADDGFRQRWHVRDSGATSSWVPL